MFALINSYGIFQPPERAKKNNARGQENSITDLVYDTIQEAETVAREYAAKNKSECYIFMVTSKVYPDFDAMTKIEEI